MNHKSLSHKTLYALIVLGALLLSLSAAALIRANPAAPAAPGDLDPTFAGFGTAGAVTHAGRMCMTSLSSRTARLSRWSAQG